MNQKEKKLHILILNYEYPPLGGGAAVISKAHALEMVRSGYKVTVVTCSYRNTYYEEESIENLKVIRLDSQRKHLFRSSISEKLDWMNKAGQFLLKEKVNYHFCMAHFSIPGGWVAYRLKRKLGIPYGVISHGQDIPWFYPRQMFIYHLVLAPIIKKILRNAERLWVQSEVMQDNATQFLKKDASKIEVIPNGCDLHWVQTPGGFPSNGEPLRLLFAGRFTRQKRPDKVLLIARELKLHGFAFFLTMAGDGAWENKLRKMVRIHDLEDYIGFTGHISTQAEMKELYKNNHLLLSPSEAEGMSIAILEALFSGMYVLCTPVSGNRELIKSGINGELLPGDPRVFAKSIMELKARIASGDKREIFYRDFVKTFNWPDIMSTYQRTIENVANKA